MADLINDPVGYARDVVGKDPMAQFLGIEVEEVSNGYARCSITIKPEYLNAVERAHGAIIYAVMDQAFAVASNSTGNVAVSLSVTVNYISAALDGEKIFAEAVPVSAGKKVSFWKLEVRGSEDKIIASGEGVAYHK
ncbi:MAG TPA: hotdog fold thioesterase [Spirochaetota bacterium]|jgi:acyl-CoA thioesterase|nr:hotdog fold thioesterase [Spirochaetota bacterium]HOK93197.1 hotdog fold thioesterase [Spirochaetota bacterium]HON16773.1 hotdog fold thioesterase [Spirochaetota bacterium]HOV09642.1 hotdog fold thioesterase [Spirochaetota bacterium]HPD78094.1 hotdog fold thioesterase [Spirochaetota bacterium]